MAWRIDDAVSHGEIDNTVEGKTTGHIWLAGRTEPLILELAGDCWRDLAGTRLRFTNPSPEIEEDAKNLDWDQHGIVGDMTASRKVKVPSVNEDEFLRLYQNQLEIPCEWKNTLSLEWFSEINGRVVLESASYKLEISPHEWQMDADAENAQKLANMNSMRDFMAQVIRRPKTEKKDDSFLDELDEYAWEERLKESDRMTEAYQEVLEKYIDDADCEQKEAFVMGWDGLLDEMAERDENGEGDFLDDLQDDEDDDNDDEESMEESDTLFYDAIDEDDDELSDDEPAHPLQAKARELAMRAMDVMQSEAGPGSPEYQLISSLLEVSGKLAGALNGRGSGNEPETGYVLAILKRCLHWLNDAVGACQQLMAVEDDPDQLAALTHLRVSAFEIRDKITELRRELK